ncbi:MAG TPA: hypothetical protein VHN55_06335 [Sphingomicrobium sp.]|nr:hypothetical protein [Sphingomicrobium sp.]
MKSSLCTLLGAAILATGFPANAQVAPPNPDRGGPPPPPPSGEDIGRRNDDFWARYDTQLRMKDVNSPESRAGPAAVARCVVSKAKGKAGTLVGGAFTDDPKYGELMSALQNKYSRCVDTVAVGLSMDLVNAAVAEELLRVEPPAVPERATIADVAAAKAFYVETKGLTIEGIGRCLAVYSPGLAYRVVQTPPASPEESAALAAVFAKTPECGRSAPPAGIAPAYQRAAVATGLYHWTHRG